MTPPQEIHTKYWLQLTEGQMIDLASGYVANAVKAMALQQLDYRREDERRAQRPVQAPKGGKRPTPPVRTRAATLKERLVQARLDAELGDL
jgi:hypothetical protein